jgi:hypothetical protein
MSLVVGASSEMSAEDFNAIRPQFGADANVTASEFLALTDEEANILMGRVQSLSDRAKLRIFRRAGKSAGYLKLMSFATFSNFIFCDTFRSYFPFAVPSSFCLGRFYILVYSYNR